MYNNYSNNYSRNCISNFNISANGSAPKRLYIFRNNKEDSLNAQEALSRAAEKAGFTVINDFADGPDLLACIGGDGTFLSFVHKCRFPKAPILGINTGHLGFFQEYYPDEIETAMDEICAGKCKIQRIRPVEANIVTERHTFNRIGVNEILVRGLFSHVSHFTVSIDETKVQEFSGDGILVSTPVGSTAYNYSLDGSLVSPDLDVLQLTPVAPMNTSAYRCFHSSILLPASEKIKIAGNGRNEGGTIILSFDGRTHEFNNVKYVEIRQSRHEIHLIRSMNYDYWSKLSSKLL